MAGQPAAAQGLETVGSRAPALGAFVAVADDASAVVWNPAGLASGPIFNIVLGASRAQAEPARADRAGRAGTMLVALGTLPLGLAYYRIDRLEAEAVSPAVLGSSGRQEERVAVRRLVTHHLGATVQHSIGDHLTLGATLKLVRGRVAAASPTVSSWDEAFEAVDREASRGALHADADIGAMFSAGSVKAGAVVRNLAQPVFGEGAASGPMGLRRHARVGIAWGDGWPGTPRTIVALDADLTRVATLAGERRDIAAGAERWIASHRVGFRASVRASTAGDARPVAAVGGSIALRAGMYVDLSAAAGARGQSGWGIAARVSY
jgi:hypothetical protein